MRELLEYAPIAAAAFAIPQFLPQILKLRATGDAAGVSWSWATLTSVNNAAWMVYFAFSGYWTALVPSSSATVLAGALATMLALRGQARAGPAVLISAWASLLILGFAVAGRTGLGALLASAFILQVTPSIWTAYRTDRPTGISRGTWMLVFGELSCWTVFGIYESDPRLLILGFTGVTASVLMLARIHRTSENERPRTPRFRPRRPDYVPADGLRGGRGAPDRRDDHPHRPASERDAHARRPELVPAPLAGLAPEVAGRGWIDGREFGTPPALEPSRASDAWAGD
jgi:uncharacterized protein with PQ loop repeat